MASAAVPAQTNNAMAPNIRRSFTAPLKSTVLPKTSVTTEPNNETDILYSHDSVRVVSFRIPADPSRRPSSSSSHDQPAEPVGILPWATSTEKVLSIGSFRVYRVLEITCFHFGNSKQPRAILPKSQCWCVDGQSKFVMKARDECYRIELPHSDKTEEDQVEKFKQVLPTILRYETTACPFKRGFQVDLPELPKEPIIVRPWKPRQASQPTTSQIFIEPQFMEESPGRWASRRNMKENDPVEQVMVESPSGGKSGVKGMHRVLGIQAENDKATAEQPPASPLTLESDPIINKAPEENIFKQHDKARRLEMARTVSAPSQSLTASPSENVNTDIISSTATSAVPKTNETSEQFRSFHSPISPLPPSPPYSDPPSPSPSTYRDTGLTVNRSRMHKRDPSELTVTADSVMFEPQLRTESLVNVSNGSNEDDTSQEDRQAHMASSIDPSSPPAAEVPWPESPTPSPRTEIRQRQMARQRSRSPMPLVHVQASPSSSSSTSVYSPTTARLSATTGRHLTTAILQKTCSILLGPPVHLVALMMDLARKIARGTYSGLTFGYGFAETPRKKGERRMVPGGWDSLSSGTEGDSADANSDVFSNTSEAQSKESRDEYFDDWDDEDDYGIAVRGNGGSKVYHSARERAEKLRAEATGIAGWGVD